MQVGLGVYGVDSLLSKSVLRVLSWVMAGVGYANYGYLDYIYRQAVPFTATDEALDGWAGLKGVVREDAQTAALTTAGQGFTTTGTAGTSLPDGTPITRSDGFQYQTTEVVTVGSNGILVAPIVATETGSIGNTPAGTILTIGNPVAGINSTGSASAAITGGTDQEQDPTFRTRMQQAYSAPAQGGNATDYKTWSLNVPGVTRAWVVPNGAGPGSVLLYTMFDEAEAAYGGFPQGTNGVATGETRGTAATGDQLTVANAIYGLRPVTALVFSLAPTPQPINVSVTDFAPNTTANQAAVDAALAEALLQVGTANGGTVFPSVLDAAIGSVPGITSYNLASPVVPVTNPVGTLPTLGIVTYTAPG